MVPKIDQPAYLFVQITRFEIRNFCHKKEEHGKLNVANVNI